MGGQVEDKKETGRANPGGIQWTKMPKLTFLFALARWACILSLPRCSPPSQSVRSISTPYSQAHRLLYLVPGCCELPLHFTARTQMYQ